MIGLGIGVSRLRRRGGGGIPDLLYNQYGVPAAGFSTRLLDKNYTGGLLRALAYDGASQQGQADVLPYDTGSGYWVDLNSKLINLDATATGRGLTDSDTLGDLVDAGGANYDGLVPTWYGQAGGIDATQSSIGAMPRIVDAGSLEVVNGKPALFFNTNQNNLLIQGLNINTNIFYCFGVSAKDGTDAIAGILSNDTTITGERFNLAIINDIPTFFVSYDDINNARLETIAYPNDTQKLISIMSELTGTNYEGEINSNLDSDTANEISTKTDFSFLEQNFAIGSLDGSMNRYFRGHIQEINIYTNSVNQIEIKSNINNAFNIYP